MVASRGSSSTSDHVRDRTVTSPESYPRVFQLADPCVVGVRTGRLAVDDEVDTVDHSAGVAAGRHVDRPLCEAVSAFR